MKRTFDSYSIFITTDETMAFVLAETLSDWNLAVHLSDNEAKASLEIVCGTNGEAERRLLALQARVPRLNCKLAKIKPIKHQDWAETWKDHFHARRVSKRIVVKPSWESFAAGPGDIILEIDPGLSFGTGLHGTTRACLCFLDKWQYLRPRASVLDIGCGSGILAIAAAKLRFPHVTAIDNDPAAVRVAKANAMLNGVAQRIQYVLADAAAYRAAKQYDFVVANLLSGILIQSVDRITAAVSTASPSGLVLSGIRSEQYDAVKSVYIRKGFEEHSSIKIAGWKTMCLRRSAGQLSVVH